MMSIERVCVAGAGLMGHGIAQVAAQTGMTVALYDVAEDFLNKGMARIKKHLSGQVQKGRLTEEAMEAVLARLKPTTNLQEAVQDAQFIIEAIPEKMDLKVKFYREIDSYSPPEAIFASNTTALSIAEMSAATKRPQQVIGMHFFNPAQVMKLVEVIKTPNTSAETVNVTKELAVRMGKTAVEINEFPGFVVTRILAPMINEAFFALMEGVASAEDIDVAMKLGTNFPMGPLQLADFMGLDTTLAAIQTLHREFADSKYRPCPLLVNLVRAGKLGVKTGSGVYQY